MLEEVLERDAQERDVIVFKFLYVSIFEGVDGRSL